MSVYPITLITAKADPQRLQSVLTHIIDSHMVNSNTGMTWFEARVGLEGSVGLLLFAAAFLLAINKDRRGVFLGYFTLLLALTMVNLLVFYFDQFSTILQAMIQFLVLLGLLRYRRLYLSRYRHKEKQPVLPNE
jgi:hypothetical protein